MSDSIYTFKRRTPPHRDHDHVMAIEVLQGCVKLCKTWNSCPTLACAPCLPSCSGQQFAASDQPDVAVVTEDSRDPPKPGSPGAGACASAASSVLGAGAGAAAKVLHACVEGCLTCTSKANR